MATFSRLNTFPIGYFRTFANWLLNSRKDVPPRLKAINEDLIRIGFVKISYETIDRGDGTTLVTEVPTALSVTPATTLEKLMRAYVMAGGNPYDVSPMWIPDTATLKAIPESEALWVKQHEYPYGGLVAPVSGVTSDQVYTGGRLNWSESVTNNVGRVYSPPDMFPARPMMDMRKPFNAEIKNRLQNLEFKIIKQMDLREQLIKERDVLLVQSFGGFLVSLPSFNEDVFDPNRRMHVLVQDMQKTIFADTTMTEPSNEIRKIDWAWE